MMNAPMPTKDPDQYDKLTHVIKKYHQQNPDYYVAYSNLRNPVSPSSTRFVKWLQSDRAREVWFKLDAYQADLNVYFTILRLAQTCVAEGKRSAAEWVLDFAYDRVPHLFSGRLQNAPFKSTVAVESSAHLLRRASKAEIEAGKQVDSKSRPVVGNLVRKPWRQWFWLAQPGR